MFFVSRVTRVLKFSTKNVEEAKETLDLFADSFLYVQSIFYQFNSSHYNGGRVKINIFIL